ncbi:MAG TPA: sugar phosphate isomerase/epimerase [Candidatus Sulfotelmatobacter sp.]|jgi:sugar phosphate isomerase/epimerase|nr:sugar phosphate isomerase/epimerase [Candidatus Sulfotelmatobacter sp.]
MNFHAVNRRTLLKTAGTAAAVSLLPSRFLWAAGEHKIDKVGVQLYTVRDLMKNDFEGTIAKVAQIGYKEVEFAGYFGRTAAQVKAVLVKNGLKAPSTHVQYDELDDKFPSVIEFSKAIDLEYIVCPWIPEDLRKNPDIWKQAADKFNKAGEQTKKAGMQFGYHNHWFEFLPTDGKLPYDELLRLCDAKLVKMEMDLCWATVAGADPVKYFEKYPGRFPLVHVKDVKTMPKVTSGGAQNYGDTVDLTEVGSGVIDWKRIFAHADQAGIKHYIVEHDHPKQPLESIKGSYEYLSKLRW